MSALDSLEKKLDELFVKGAPALPAGFKKWLVKYLPWINAVLAVFTIFAVIGLWHTAHSVNQLVDYANSLSQAYGGSSVAAVNHIGFTFYIAIAFLILEAILYLAAFPGARDKKKSGWNFMFYALLVNIVYGIAMVFTDYGSIGNLISTLIGSGIGGYILFQIRSSYSTTGKAPATAKAKKA